VRNLEIKSSVASLSDVRARLRRLPAAESHAKFLQTDWYFVVPRGRMKLREIRAGQARAAELIVYLRPDARAARTSQFVRLPAEECGAARRLLTGMFGVSVCVRKAREVWLCENARIHFDRVRGLGTFVEIEVVVKSGMAQARRLMAMLRAALGIEPGRVIGQSYADLLRTGPSVRGRGRSAGR
jgi:adenylate cyclase, class 2